MALCSTLVWITVNTTCNLISHCTFFFGLIYFQLALFTLELVQIELIKAGAIPHLLDIMETVSSPSSPDTPFGKYELAIAAIRLLSSLCESGKVVEI